MRILNTQENEKLNFSFFVSIVQNKYVWVSLVIIHILEVEHQTFKFCFSDVVFPL